MRFTHFYRNASYVVTPTYHILQGLNKVPVRGIRADFRNHQFDSQQAQKNLGWSDEQRDTVEKYLLAHGDFDKERGLHLDVTETQPGSKAAKAAAEKTPAVSCAFVEEVDNETHVCGARVKKGSEYCRKHEALVLADAGVM